MNRGDAMLVVVERVIKHPVETVFDLIADQAKTNQWCLALTECRLTADDPISTGSKRVVARKFLGMKMEWEFDLDAFDRPRTLTWSTDKGTMPTVETYVLEESEGGTQVRHTIDTQLKGLMAWLAPLAAAKGRKDMAKDLEALEGLLDAP